tara:strand:+ start:272 stop:541 length:270 start_codon:yes stop_codon:yes gene_type:complete
VPYKVSRKALTTSNTVVSLADNARKSISFFNTDQSIIIHVTQGQQTTGYPIPAQSSLSLDVLIDGDIVTYPFQIAAESGTPTVAIMEAF